VDKRDKEGLNEHARILKENMFLFDFIKSMIRRHTDCLSKTFFQPTLREQ